MRIKKLLSFISIVLVITILSGSLQLGAFAAEDSKDAVKAAYSENDRISGDPDIGYDELSVTPPSRNRSSLRLAATVWDGTSVYSNGVIFISNFYQLSQIGTGSEVSDTDTNSLTVSLGDPIHLSGSGTVEDPYVNRTYSNDAV